MSSRDRKRKETKFISSILSFLMAMFLFVFVALLLFYCSFLNNSTITKNLHKASYYIGMQEYIIGKSNDIILPTGLPDSIFEEVFELTTVKRNIEEYINAQLSGKDFSIKEDEIREKLSKNIAAYLVEAELEDQVVSESAIQEIINELVEEYSSNIKFPFISQISKFKKIYKVGMLITCCISLLFSIMIGAILYKMNKWVHRWLRYIAYSVGGCSLMLLLGPAFIKIWGVYNRVQLTPQFAYDFMVIHVEQCLNLFLTFGVFFLMIEIVLIVLGNEIYKKIA